MSSRVYSASFPVMGVAVHGACRHPGQTPSRARSTNGVRPFTPGGMERGIHPAGHFYESWGWFTAMVNYLSTKRLIGHFSDKRVL
jgi:hypothetical protein